MRMRIPTPQEQKEFHSTFGLYLNTLWNPIFGFDVIAFDRLIQTPDGISCRDHVRSKHGESAVKLLLGLMQVAT